MYEYQWLFLMTWILVGLSVLYTYAAVTRKPPQGPTGSAS